MRMKKYLHGTGSEKAAKSVLLDLCARHLSHLFLECAIKSQSFRPLPAFKGLFRH